MVNKYLVEMKKISKSFGAVKALQDVDFEVGEQEIVGLVGDNAAGKSTLMKVLNGALSLDSGKIYFESKEVNFKSPKDAINLGIEMVYQDLAVFESLDVKSNIFIGREIMGGYGIPFFLNEKKMLEKSQAILEKFGLNINSMKLKVINLSGGQRQGVAICRVMLFDAKLVIMDEPTSAMAVKETEKILELILDLKKAGVSVVIISHRMDDIFKVGDRVIVLKRGKRVGSRIIRKTSKEEVVKMIVNGS